MDGITPHRAADRRSCAALAVVLAFAASPALASSLEQAKRIHDRLAGVPPDSGVLADMKAKIDANHAIDAAYEAMDNKAFYNATLKNWITPWTNRDGNKFAPLNDYTATVIGIIRDDKDYRTVLYDNILYVGAPNVVPDGYSTTSNNHYAELEANDIPLGDATKLIPATQTYLPSGAQAGVITTRAAARAFFIDGTNRAMFRFTLKNHLCHDMEDAQDTTRPTDRIRQDVSRSPGGDSRIFMNNCVGCHSGMDPMAQAFAYYNFAYNGAGNEDTGQLTYKTGITAIGPGGTEKKYHINTNHFSNGFVTPNDAWNNYWREGPNAAIFGWSATVPNNSTPGSGQGATSMLTELAYSDAFAVCSVKKVFKVVCLRDPNENDRTTTVNGIGGFKQMLDDFKTNHKLKNTFAEAAVYCAGD